MIMYLKVGLFSKTDPLSVKNVILFIIYSIHSMELYNVHYALD